MRSLTFCSLLLQLSYSRIQLQKQVEDLSVFKHNLSDKLSDLNEAYTQLSEVLSNKEKENVEECFKLDKELKSVLNSNQSLADAKSKLEVCSRPYSCHLTDRCNIDQCYISQSIDASPATGSASSTGTMNTITTLTLAFTNVSTESSR